MVDVWTESHDAEEYIEFLRRLIDGLSRAVDPADDEAAAAMKKPRGGSGAGGDDDATLLAAMGMALEGDDGPGDNSVSPPSAAADGAAARASSADGDDAEGDIPRRLLLDNEIVFDPWFTGTSKEKVDLIDDLMDAKVVSSDGRSRKSQEANSSAKGSERDPPARTLHDGVTITLVDSGVVRGAEAHCSAWRSRVGFCALLPSLWVRDGGSRVGRGVRSTGRAVGALPKAKEVTTGLAARPPSSLPPLCPPIPAAGHAASQNRNVTPSHDTSPRVSSSTLVRRS